MRNNPRLVAENSRICARDRQVREPMDRLDPNAAAAPGSGIFGLQHSAADAAVVLMPVPFAATQSYGSGAERAPAAILAASHQVDLYDLQTGRPYLRGIHMLPESVSIAAQHQLARPLVTKLLATGGTGDGDAATICAVDAACEAVGDAISAELVGWLCAGKIVGVVGGDHSVAYGALRAVVGQFPGVGVLQIDAHADLRPAYCGLRWSHASVMANVCAELPEVARIVQVGVREFCEAEAETVAASAGRVRTWYDLDLRRRLAAGETLQTFLEEVVAALPERVYLSFDIDGLDPRLCPHTGTPVPGGLGFHEICLLLEALHAAGRHIVGFDLSEVVPGPDGDDWDTNVAARILYKLCGFALLGPRPRG